jgi:hypothetical protein
VPASIVARELNIRLINTIGIASYDHQDQGTARVLKEADAGDGNGWLIVDDLIDTGATARIVRERLPKAHFATIYTKPSGRPLWIPSLPKSARIPGFYFRGTWRSHMHPPSAAGNRIPTLRLRRYRSIGSSRDAQRRRPAPVCSESRSALTFLTPRPQDILCGRTRMSRALCVPKR